jgi:hypothetical protein
MNIIYLKIFGGQYVNNNERPTPPYSFEVGGTDYSRFSRNDKNISAKLDWTTQLNQEINIQFGGELKQHDIKFHELYLFRLMTAGNILIPAATTNQNNRYHRNPQERAVYVQSKLEAFNI